MEVAFEEAREHLGMETQRQWSDLAIARATPIILGLFSLVTIFASKLQEYAQRQFCQFFTHAIQDSV